MPVKFSLKHFLASDVTLEFSIATVQGFDHEG